MTISLHSQEDNEFARQYLTVRPTTSVRVRAHTHQQDLQDNDEPNYVDWRTRNAVTVVKDQVCVDQ